MALNMDGYPMWVKTVNEASVLRAPPGLGQDIILPDVKKQAPMPLDGGLGMFVPRKHEETCPGGWLMQEMRRSFANLDSKPQNLGNAAQQVTSPPVISLLHGLETQVGKLDARKVPSPVREVVHPVCFDADKARSQRFAPKKRDLLSQYSHHDGPIVTLMIRNIPCRVTQQHLLDVINGMGFAGKYDFLYLPTGGRSSTVGSSNLGYGFINFIDPSDTEPFIHAFAGYQFEGTSSTKVCTVRPAHIQGLENNIVHFDRTAAKGRPRREGPFIRTSMKKESPGYLSRGEEGNAGMAQELNSCAMEELAWLEPSYFDFLEEAPEVIVGYAF
jgi:hypothetical protein